MAYAKGSRTPEECSKLPVPILEFESRVLEMAARSCTIQEICDDIGICPASYYNFKNRNPEFKALVETTLLDASTALVEQLKQIPYNEDIEIARAKLQLEGIRSYLELRWPDRYGKRMQVTVKTVDMRGALRRARDRVDKLRTIDSTVVDTHDTHDTASLTHDTHTLDVVAVAAVAVENSCENNDVSTIDELL